MKTEEENETVVGKDDKEDEVGGEVDALSQEINELKVKLSCKDVRKVAGNNDDDEKEVDPSEVGITAANAEHG